MLHILNKIKRSFPKLFLSLSATSLLFIQKLTAVEPQGIAKDYGIDLQNPVTEVARDVYSMHTLHTVF